MANNVSNFVISILDWEPSGDPEADRIMAARQVTLFIPLFSNSPILSKDQC